jgi:peptidoglycan LD-endopeptidase LytH
MVGRLLFLVLIAVWGTAQASERLAIVWPTPNPAYAEKKPPVDWVQPTVSGRWESALFGCVRNSGARFHEGLDLRPISRDSRGEATDPVYAVMDGRVAYVNPNAGHSGYGRYIIIEHRHIVPAVITLYAHLTSIDEAVTEGAEVRIGQTIGIMGRSAGGYTIPRERAHLHFEIGFWVSEDFQSWYEWKRYGSPNHHGFFNGMNMIGVNPLEFYDEYRAGTISSVQDYVDGLPVAFTVRVKSDRVPDFIRRYPTLLQGGMPVRGVGGWEIDFTSFGLPKAWRALSADLPELIDQRERTRVISHDARIVAEHACRNTVSIQRGRASIASHTERTLQLLFGFR